MKNALISKGLIIFLILILTLIPASCKKNYDVLPESISVLIDDYETSFDKGAFASWFQHGNGAGGILTWGLWISGNTMSLDSSIMITITSPYVIKAKTYNNVEIAYFLDMGSSHTSYITSTATVTITDYNFTYIKGTFSGILKDNEGATKEFTGGAFYLNNSH